MHSASGRITPSILPVRGARGAAWHTTVTNRSRRGTVICRAALRGSAIEPSAQDAAQEQLAQVAIGLEPRHARHVEDLVERQRAVDARQQERRARADRRGTELMQRAGERGDALEVAEERLERVHDDLAVAVDQLLR